MMRHKLFYSAIIILLATNIQILFAQAPEGMNYQAVARDASGAILPNQNVSLKITITDGNGGSAVYRETHSATTNQFGLFTLNIGSGTVLLGTFATINWKSISA